MLGAKSKMYDVKIYFVRGTKKNVRVYENNNSNETYTRYTLEVQAVSCDEMFVCLTPVCNECQTSPLTVAKCIREHITNSTKCPVSAGLGWHTRNIICLLSKIWSWKLPKSQKILCLSNISNEKKFRDVSNCFNIKCQYKKSPFLFIVSYSRIASSSAGPNLLVARLVTRRAKPDGQCYIEQDDVAEFMAEQRISDLPGQCLFVLVSFYFLH